MLYKGIQLPSQKHKKKLNRQTYSDIVFVMSEALEQLGTLQDEPHSVLLWVQYKTQEVDGILINKCALKIYYCIDLDL